MADRIGVVTFKGNGVTLSGNEVKVGEAAPNVRLKANDMSDVDLDKYRGKTLIISSVPSLDTPVCDVQTKRFNDEAGKLGEGVAVVTVSMDLPFAQRRWCGAAGAKHVTVLSDYKDRQFAENYGLLIKELGLLARAVLVVDKQGLIRHLEVVPEVTKEPNYDAAINAAKAAA